MKKIAKIIFKISMLPYAFLLIGGIISMFTGYSELFGKTLYGFGAAVLFIKDFLILMTFFNILPACIIYQIIYNIFFCDSN